LKQIPVDAIQEGNAQYEIFVETTENQFGRYLFNRPNTSMNNYIKLKEMQDCIDNKNTMIEEKMIMWEELGEE